MKAMSLTSIALVAGAAMCHAQEVACPQDIKPVEGSMPGYPSSEQAKPYLPGTSYMHVFVEGSVVVAFTVSTSGAVTNARIAQSSYKLVGRNASHYKPGYFDGFLDMNVLPAVRAWRYSPRAQPCASEYTFTYRIGAQPSAELDTRFDTFPG